MFMSKIFRFEAVRGGNIVRTPGLQFPDGFHIRVQEKDTSIRKQHTTPDT